MQLAGHVSRFCPYTFIRAHATSLFLQTMTSRVTFNHLFPLLELPDDVLANVLQRCPPGSIAGFPLPLALAQVRVTGSVDNNWLRPLLHLAAKCPAVLNRLTPHLRSIELLESQSTSPLIPIVPFLTRLERLSIDQKVSTVTLNALPCSLTKLSVRGVDLKGGSLEDASASLLRLTALEELKLGEFPNEARRAVIGSLPRLRRLGYSLGPLTDLGTFAPNLEALEGTLMAVDFGQLPSTLTELRFVERPTGSLLPLTRLTGLKDLSFTCFMNIASELPELLRALVALTHLEVRDHDTNNRLTELVEALEKGPESPGLCLDDVKLDAEPPALERLFRHLVGVSIRTGNASSPPWAALTRVTRLRLDVDGRKDASWILPLSRLPSLRDLQVMLRAEVPAGLGALTQCTRLDLRDIQSTTQLSCLRHLTRLQECHFDARLPVECLEALPDSLTKLHVSRIRKSPDLPLGAALQHLTALEDLGICFFSDDWVSDLSPFTRLTSLCITNVRDPVIRLGPLPCLRSLRLGDYVGINAAFLRQLGQKAPSLRKLTLVPGRESSITDAGLKSLTRLSQLEELTGCFDVTPKTVAYVLNHLPLLDRLQMAADIDLKELLQDKAWAGLKHQAGNRLELK